MSTQEFFMYSFLTIGILLLFAGIADSLTAKHNSIKIDKTKDLTRRPKETESKDLHIDEKTTNIFSSNVNNKH